jgi:hypothetical protein
MSWNPRTARHDPDPEPEDKITTKGDLVLLQIAHSKTLMHGGSSSYYTFDPALVTRATKYGSAISATTKSGTTRTLDGAKPRRGSPAVQPFYRCFTLSRVPASVFAELPESWDTIEAATAALLPLRASA